MVVTCRSRNRARRSVVPVIVGFLVGIGFGAGLHARPPVDYGNPGYKWGRANCGPGSAQKKSEQQCKNCCNAGYQEQMFPIDDLNLEACRGFCERVPWLIWS